MYKENDTIPFLHIVNWENENQMVVNTTDQIFQGKRVLLFSMPGAFLPTCTKYHLPQVEQNYSEFLKYNIDEVYCITMNDAHVLNAWAEKLGIQNVKLLPDANAYFTNTMGQMIRKTSCGYGERSWRYALVIDNLIIEKIFEEPGKTDDTTLDPYIETTPENVLDYLRNKVD